MSEVIGEDKARALYTELYKQPFHKENLSISTKKAYKSSDTEKYVYELKDNRYIETEMCIRDRILTPYRKRSAAGVDELNKSLEDFVNPSIAGKKELHIGSQVFRVGDKILQNKNTEMASNGDLGRILDLSLIHI